MKIKIVPPGRKHGFYIALPSALLYPLLSGRLTVKALVRMEQKEEALPEPDAKTAEEAASADITVFSEKDISAKKHSLAKQELSAEKNYMPDMPPEVLAALTRELFKTLGQFRRRHKKFTLIEVDAVDGTRIKITL